MGEDDLVELLWKSGRVVQSSHTQRPPSDKPSTPPLILRGSGSGGGEENAPLPLPLSLPPPMPPSPPPPPPPMYHQNLFIQEDEMASWLHHSYSQDYWLYSDVDSTPATHQQSSVSLAQPPSAPYILPPERPTGQILATRRAENFMNFSRLRANILSSGRVEEAGPSIPVEQVGSSATTSSLATESCVIPATEGTESQVPRTFALPGLGRRGKAVAIVTAGTPSAVVCKVETEPAIHVQPAVETEIADERKRKEREETTAEFQRTEAGRGSTSKKRSRNAETHNLAEKKRREKINEKIKTLQEIIPRCNKSNRAAMLEDVINYVKSLEMRVQTMSTGFSMMPPMNAANMQWFNPHMATGMMGMNQSPPFILFPGAPFPWQAHMAGLSPPYPVPRYPFPNTQPSDPSNVHLSTLQSGSNPVSNQPQFPAYINPYSQFVGLHQTQQPPAPLQSQTTSQPNFGQASSSKEPEDQDNQPTG